ncbi:H+-pyrophosphatase [Tripterygium wilfordii]|uniref:H(+)-exporting diphosphatase n=1 Tax=Tripterygium wilfordii TaxID=458696 RepID=A0A7J7DK58_TRIWF|nr:pyrophosphate-energized vacuolar membrane proton pump-like [Tripterygium wilfordii]KAF5746707.1 H+-pyrophosphatase [Tripterygium wilfordii]
MTCIVHNILPPYEHFTLPVHQPQHHGASKHFFGEENLAGVLAGSLVSGVQVAISASNTGEAWDNAKKYIQRLVHMSMLQALGPKGSDAHKAAVIDDNVGDPLKDMAVESLVFAPFFATHGGLLFKLL